MIQKIEELIAEIESVAVVNNDELEEFRLKYLSKKGIISVLFDDFRNVAPENKRETGQKLNVLKQTATEKYNNLKNEFSHVDD